MSKTILWKLFVLMAVGVGVVWASDTLTPMIVADSAVSQLEDSDSSYLGFKFTQNIPTISTVAYFVFAGLLFRKEITKLFKGDK